MKYWFVHQDGNTGEEIAFDTIDAAVDEADIAWHYLTKAEKLRYTRPGCFFCVCTKDGDDIDQIIRDYTLEVE